MNRRNRQIRCSDFPNLNKISAALLRARHLDCSQSYIDAKDRQDPALTGTEGAGVAVYGGGGREARKISTPPKLSPAPRHLSIFDNHPQARLGTFDPMMATHNAKRSISTILRKNRGL